MADEATQPTPPKAEDKIDEKSTKLAFLKQFRGLNIKDKESQTGAGVGKLITQEEATEQVYKKIVEIKSSDYWIIRIRKKTVLLFLGLMIAAMWIFILGQKLWQVYGGKVSFSNGMIVIQHDVQEESTNSPLPVVDGPLIRIRNTVIESQGSEEIANLLKDKGYLNVELVPDTESTLSGVSIVVKPGNDVLLTELQSALEATYKVGSPAAALTVDSDFDAVIFYGIDAKK
jgi:hypothetical protein